MAIRNYTLKNGQERFEVRAKFTDKSGKELCRRKAGFLSLKDAENAEFELRAQLYTESGRRTHYTWSSWHRVCIERMRHELKLGTVEGYGRELQKRIPKEWEHRLLDSFTRSDVHELLFIGMAEFSANRRMHILKKVRRIFEMAVEEGILSQNPARGIRVKVPPPNQQVLTASEAETLLQAAFSINHRYAPVWTVALLTGMRSGELFALRWSDIDLEAGVIQIKRQWTRQDGVHSTKSNCSRVVPVSDALSSYLKEWRLSSGGGFEERLWDGYLKAWITLSDLVLPRLTEWRQGLQANVLRDFCRGVGVTEIKFHDLRATFITNLLSQGVPLVQVMAMVGHAKMSTTDRYLRLAGVPVKGATQRLGYRLPSRAQAKVVSLTRAQDA